jgi:hypothetical protein
MMQRRTRPQRYFTRSIVQMKTGNYSADRINGIPCKYTEQKRISGYYLDKYAIR